MNRANATANLDERLKDISDLPTETTGELRKNGQSSVISDRVISNR
ncbi:MAG: hypothetical protein L0241_26235 [Planctomycetia bacterium]|nr:hypothetical protein [Planctomycetia bacterium]